MGLQIVRKARDPSFRSGNTMVCCSTVFDLLLLIKREKKGFFSFRFL